VPLTLRVSFPSSKQWIGNEKTEKTKSVGENGKRSLLLHSSHGTGVQRDGLFYCLEGAAAAERLKNNASAAAAAAGNVDDDMKKASFIVHGSARHEQRKYQKGTKNSPSLLVVHVNV